MDRTVEAAALAGSRPPTDLSFLGLFLNADLIGKSVIVLLILASFWSWAIIIEKLLRLRRLQARADEFEDMFWSGGSLDDLYDRVGAEPPCPMTAMFSAAMREWRRSAAKGLAGANQVRAALQSRIERVMGVTFGREMDRLERYMSFLASVGSTAPFIGLFGTVWGIMNAFHAIAASKNTSLAVVAPGIAEALFATAIGLFAAIPAVIAYNRYSHGINRFEARLNRFADGFHTTLSRQLDGSR